MNVSLARLRFGSFLHHQRGELLTGALPATLLENEEFAFQGTNPLRGGALAGGQERHLLGRPFLRGPGGRHSRIFRQGPLALWILLCGHRNAESADAMAVPVVMVEAESEPTAPTISGRILQPGDKKVTLSKARTNGPTGFGITIDGVLGLVILLFPIGRGAAEEEVGVGRSGALLGSGSEGEFVEDEIAAGAPTTRTILRQARIRQYFEQNGRNARQVGVGLDGDGVVNGVNPGSQEGSVRQVRVTGTAGRLGVDQLESAPGVCLPSHRLLPGGLGFLKFLLDARKLIPGLLQPPRQVRVHISRIGLRHFDGRAETVVARVGTVVEERVKAVVLLVGDRIVLVRVALSTVQGES